MIDPIDSSLRIAGAGLHAQSTRVRVVSENLANAQSTGQTPGSDPYRRKTVTFASAIDQASGSKLVQVKGVGVDRAPFRLEYDPNHPAADAKGFVKMPNVSMLLEMADMREANRSYEANLQMIKQARSMQAMTIDLLRNG
ncbi:flagellar basal body rod protein FlgC [Bosea sp. BH3]|uniref:flagellar basal body rod protein FlgC n=1 Tax=Bosea sp. BH3 TaxID=2871701 RepID=UPI0021CB5F67|nr:flagellar basal body rod protein FlgC [Bosea sp. BH3]MCU4179524.1 flagellar basal body rod protein FlgC [Bosea sp. BH3]